MGFLEKFTIHIIVSGVIIVILFYFGILEFHFDKILPTLFEGIEWIFGLIGGGIKYALNIQ